MAEFAGERAVMLSGAVVLEGERGVPGLAQLVAPLQRADWRRCDGDISPWRVRWWRADSDWPGRGAALYWHELCATLRFPL